jgi:hypothetical protein
VLEASGALLASRIADRSPETIALERRERR